MKFRNIFWGVILVFIGVLFLLENFDVINFAWMSLWRIWPVILILWGVTILPANNWIKTGLVVVVLAGTLYFMINYAVRWGDEEINDNWDNWSESFNDSIDQEFSLPFEDSLQFASLQMDAAAGKFEIGQTTDNLVDFRTNGGNVAYNYNINTSDSLTKISIERENVEIKHKQETHQVVLLLNKYPTWDLNFEVGASAMNIDLSSYKVSDLTIEGGAASFDIKLGDENPKINVSIEAGASSIEIKVPETSGCDLKINSVLTDKTIEGFKKTDNGHYQTENFEQSENKIYLNVEAAVSSYSIIRY
jgi:hypothetical protein